MTQTTKLLSKSPVFTEEQQKIMLENSPKEAHKLTGLTMPQIYNFQCNARKKLAKINEVTIYLFTLQNNR